VLELDSERFCQMRTAGRADYTWECRKGSRLFFAASFSSPRSFPRALRFCNAQTWKNIKSGLVTDIALHRAKHRYSFGISLIPSFAQRQRHMRDRCPDKHHDSTRYPATRIL